MSKGNAVYSPGPPTAHGLKDIYGCGNLAVGAYSQGAALTHRAIESRPKKAMKKISGVVLYRDIQNLQDKGRIPNFSRAKTLIICNEGDVICAGNLTIAYPHISYIARVPEALSFFADQVGNTRT